MKAKILILFLALAGILPPAVQAQVNYAVSGNTAYVTNSFVYDSIVIASNYDGYPVTSIGNDAFVFSEGLTSITIPNSITNIGDYAFSGCDLKNVIIPNSVLNIGNNAFYDCYLTNVIIGTNVLSIGQDVFVGCNLSSVTIPGSVTNLGSLAFAYCNLTNIMFLGNAPASEEEDAFIGDPAKVVYYYYGTTGWSPYFGGLPTAELDTPPLTYFLNFVNPDTITISGYTGTNGTVTIAGVINGYPITSIRSQAFYGCTNLTNVIIGNSVTNIGDEAFYGCVNLKTVAISSSITAIGEGTFYFCTNLTSVVIPNSVASIGEWAFYRCNSLTNITIANGVENIGNDAFNDCYNLTNIVIPNSVTNIGDGAFVNCSLTNITFLGNAPNLGSFVFPDDYFGTVYYYYGTSGWGTTYGGLRTMMLGVVPFAYATNDGVINITGYVGTNSTVTIASVINGYPVASIGDGAFANCGLKNITFLGNAPTLGDDVFSGDSATVYYYYGASGWGTIYGGLPVVEMDVPFTYITNDNAITITGYIGTNSTVIIGDPINGYPVTSVGEEAFTDSILKTITISTNVTNIDDKAFQDCIALTDITFLGNAPTLGGTNVFANDSATIYFYYGTSGWGTMWGGTSYEGLPTMVLNTPFDYALNNNVITITGYTGTNGTITIPTAINDHFVTSIGDWAFLDCNNLTNVIVGNGITSIGYDAFGNCSDLTSVIIPDSVTNISDFAFSDCTGLTNIIFLGNAPAMGYDMFLYAMGNGVFENVSGAVYYYYGTSGWSTTCQGLPTLELAWTPQIVGGANVQSNNFSFSVIGTNGMPVIVEASTNLMDWQPVWTNTLSGASATFTDSQWTNYPTRFYRAR